MNIYSPDFLIQSQRAFSSMRTLTLDDLRHRIAADESLGATRRRDLLSALKRLETLFGRSLDTLCASPSTIRDLFENANAVRLGVTPKTLANIRSLAIQAIRQYGETTPPLRQRFPFSDEWAALMDRISVPYHRHGLSRLAAYCSLMDIPPDKMSEEVLLGLEAALVAEEFVKKPRTIIKTALTTWNRCSRSINGWPQINLHSPFKKTPYTYSMTRFPDSFQQEVSAWVKKMRDPDPLDFDAPVRPLRPSTIESRVFQILQYASTLVRGGDLAIEEITGLSPLFTPGRFKLAMRALLDRNGGETTLRIFHFANAMRHLAKHHCRLDDDALDELANLAKRLDPHTGRQMSQRNRDLLRQFDDPRNVARLLRFPEKQVKLAKREQNPYRAAKRVERALSVALMISCGLRSGTLRALEIEAEFSWSRPDRSGVCNLSIRPEKTKTGQPLEFELPPDVADLLRLYLKEYRPLLPGSHGAYLLPGQSGGMRSRQAFRDGISRALSKDTGLVMHPHLIRHTIAKIAVEQDPGAYLAVSRVLGHSSLDTTMGRYLGTESKAAARHIDKLLMQAMGQERV